MAISIIYTIGTLNGTYHGDFLYGAGSQPQTINGAEGSYRNGWGAVKFDFGGGDVLYVENMTLNTDFTDSDIII